MTQIGSQEVRSLSSLMLIVEHRSFRRGGRLERIATGETPRWNSVIIPD